MPTLKQIKIAARGLRLFMSVLWRLRKAEKTNQPADYYKVAYSCDRLADFLEEIEADKRSIDALGEVSDACMMRGRHMATVHEQ